jgi:hypothetical protein
MLTAINTSKDIPVIATPRAVPAAGGCSVSGYYHCEYCSSYGK